MLRKHPMKCVGLMTTEQVVEWQLFTVMAVRLLLPGDLEECAQLTNDDRIDFVFLPLQAFADLKEHSLAPVALASPSWVITLEQEPTDAEREFLRQRGASLIMSGRPDAAMMHTIVDQLSKAKKDLPQPPATLAAALRLLADVPHSLRITVQRSGTPNLNQCAWSSMRLTPESGPWFGRVYLKDGVVVHAETPESTGESALRELLAIAQPNIQVVPNFIMPCPAKSLGQIQSALEAVEADQAPKMSTRSPQMPLEQILAELHGARGVAVCDHEGNVHNLSGRLDAEVSCAIATMCQGEVRKMAELLGADHVSAWSLGQGETTLYQVSLPNQEQIIALGGATRNPGNLLRKLGTLSKSL